jgi:hypothetical protein
LSTCYKTPQSRKFFLTLGPYVISITFFQFCNLNAASIIKRHNWWTLPSNYSYPQLPYIPNNHHKFFVHEMVILWWNIFFPLSAKMTSTQSISAYQQHQNCWSLLFYFVTLPPNQNASTIWVKMYLCVF